MKKTTTVTIIVLTLTMLFFTIPKPYSLSTNVKSCDRNDAVARNINSPALNTNQFFIEDLGIPSIIYVNETSGWCAGIIYPTNKERESDFPTTSCKMVTKGWDCLGAKFSKKESIAL